MSYLTSLGLHCLNYYMGMITALTYHVGGLNTSDQCLACSEHSVYVSNCYYGCSEHSVGSQICGVIWGRRDEIRVWQFINSEEHCWEGQMSDGYL